MRWYFSIYRLSTLLVGISILTYGAAVEGLADWDVGVSLLMAVATYLLMPAFNYYLTNTKTWVAAFMVLNFCVDTTYGVYWDYLEHSEVAVHCANYPASALLFLLCWAAWCLVPDLVNGRLETLSAAYKSLLDLLKACWRTTS